MTLQLLILNFLIYEENLNFLISVQTDTINRVTMLTLLITAEVGSAACFSGPQYTIPQPIYRSAQNAITQCFQICKCAVRNAAIADTSATHNHSKEKIKLQNKTKSFLLK
jgi:hypothetical protein